MESGGGAVVDGVFVVASSQSPPLLETAEPAFNDVPVAVIIGVQADGPSAA